MKSDWMTASSYGRTRELITSINTISIHAKLVLADMVDPHNGTTLKKARETLSAFLVSFENILDDATRSPNGVIIGSDPRMAELAQTFLSERQHLPHKSELFTLPLNKLNDLVNSDKKEEMQELINCLRDLRGILEQHAHSDVVGILGEI
jgi:hypothetical protein